MYVVRCANGALYTGITTDVARRVRQHNAGRGARYTRIHRPVVPVAAWRFDATDDDKAHSRALRAEAQFKKLPRARKLAEVAGAGDWAGGVRVTDRTEHDSAP